MLEMLFLAIVQGITEWLPISSSGHLVIAQHYLGLKLPVFFDVVLHLGSLLVVLTVFWRDAVKILKALVLLDFKSEEGKLGLYVVLGSIATAVIGFAFRDLFESFFYNVMAVGVALILTGGFYSVLYVFRHGRTQNRPMNPLVAVLVGIAQGIALIPGVSRSGSTIGAALLLKVGRNEAFRFSFLLFMPAAVGATVLSALGAEGLVLEAADYVSLLVGFVATTVVGYLSLRLLRKIVLKGKLYLFAYYCWALGSLLVLAQVLGF